MGGTDHRPREIAAMLKISLPLPRPIPTGSNLEVAYLFSSADALVASPSTKDAFYPVCVCVCVCGDSRFGDAAQRTKG